MITPDARSRLTDADLTLVNGSGSPYRVESIGVDAALDRPEVRLAVLDGRMPGPSPSLFFYVLVRHALIAEGITDRVLADYYAALLREFGVRRRANQPAAVDDQEHHYLIDVLQDLERSSGRRRFLVSVHLGNYALWLTGLFPDRIEARRIRRAGPALGYYEALGRQGFTAASEHECAEMAGLEEVLALSAEVFPIARRALNRVRGDLKLAA